jgi:hypothetical protein
MTQNNDMQPIWQSRRSTQVLPAQTEPKHARPAQEPGLKTVVTSLMTAGLLAVPTGVVIGLMETPTLSNASAPSASTTRPVVSMHIAQREEPQAIPAQLQATDETTDAPSIAADEPTSTTTDSPRVTPSHPDAAQEKDGSNGQGITFTPTSAAVIRPPRPSTPAPIYAPPPSPKDTPTPTSTPEEIPTAPEETPPTDDTPLIQVNTP